MRDAPSAFSSTYEKESLLSDVEWNERIGQWSGDHSVTYLAKDDGVPCGIVGAFLNSDDPMRAYLVSMWVAPTHRRHGIGAALVRRIVDWARAGNARSLELLVTSNNGGAIRLYERLGFAMTGKIAPHANDPSLGDCEMSRSLM